MMADELPVAWVYHCPHTQQQMLMGKPLLEAEVENGWTETPLYTRPSTPPAVSDDLVEEIAAALDEWIGCTETTSEMARAILPIIHRREQQAAEAMRERCAEEADANRTDDGSMWDRAAETIATAIRSLTTEKR